MRTIRTYQGLLPHEEHICTYLGISPHEEDRLSTPLHQCIRLWAPPMSDRLCAFPPRCLCTMFPGSSALFSPLCIPGQSLPSDHAHRHPYCVANPTPFTCPDVWGYWFLNCCPPQALVADLLWSLDTGFYGELCRVIPMT